MRDKDEVGQVAAKLLNRWCLRKNNEQRKWKGRNMIKNTNLLNLRCLWDNLAGYWKYRSEFRLRIEGKALGVIYIDLIVGEK